MVTDKVYFFEDINKKEFDAIFGGKTIHAKKERDTWRAYFDGEIIANEDTKKEIKERIKTDFWTLIEKAATIKKARAEREAEEARKEAEEEREYLAKVAKVREGMSDGAPLASFSWEEIKAYFDNEQTKEGRGILEQLAGRFGWSDVWEMINAIEWTSKHAKTSEPLIFDNCMVWGENIDALAVDLVGLLRSLGFTSFVDACHSTSAIDTAAALVRAGATLSGVVTFEYEDGWSRRREPRTNNGLLFTL